MLHGLGAPAAPTRPACHTRVPTWAALIAVLAAAALGAWAWSSTGSGSSLSVVASLHGVGGSQGSQHSATTAAEAQQAGAAAAEAQQCISEQVHLIRGAEQLQPALQTPARNLRPLALAIPVHGPKFKFVPELLTLKKRLGVDWDVVFILTAPHDEEALRAFLALQGTRGFESDLADYFTPLLLSDWLNEGRRAAVLREGSSIVTAKKYFAVAALRACYELVMTPDAEIQLMRPVELLSAARIRVESKLVLASEVPAGHWAKHFLVGILNASSQHLAERDRARLHAATDGMKLYSWFSHLPVWESSTVTAFLYANGMAAGRLPTEWAEFDYLSYELWQVATQHWKVVSINEAVDRTFPLPEDIQQAHHYKAIRRAFPPFPQWLPKTFCRRNPDVCEDPHDRPVIVFHQDRPDGDDEHSVRWR